MRRDLARVGRSEWVDETEFVAYARKGYTYTCTGWHHAEALAKKYNGQAWTEHSGEGSSLFYQRGNGVVDVLGYLIVTPKPLPSRLQNLAPHYVGRILWE